MRTHDRSITASETFRVAGWTALVTLILLALLLFVPLDTRNARGQQQEMTGFEIWRRTLTHLPSHAPLLLNTWTLTVLAIVALVSSAYIIVAIARLPQ